MNRKLTVLACFLLALSISPACGDDEHSPNNDMPEGNSDVNASSDDTNDDTNGEAPGNGAAGANSDGNSDTNSIDPNMGDDNSFGGGEPAFYGLEMWMMSDFGDVEVGEEESRTLEVVNESEDMIFIEFVETELDSFSVDPPVDDWPDEFESEESFEAEVTFAPTVLEPKQGSITLGWSFEGDDAVYEHRSTMIGNRACMEIEPADLEYSVVDVGDSERKSVTVTNCSGLVAYAVQPTYAASGQGGFADSDAFSLVDEDKFPTHLQPSESVDVEVEYTPTGEAWYQGNITISTDVGLAELVRLIHVDEMAEDNYGPAYPGDNAGNQWSGENADDNAQDNDYEDRANADANAGGDGE